MARAVVEGPAALRASRGISMEIATDGGRMLTVDGVPYARVQMARTPWRRLRGWLGYRPHPGEALWLEPCRAVHTAGMAVPIDVVFIDKSGRVLRVVRRMRPFRFAACPGAAVAVEFPEGGATGIPVGAIVRVDG